MCVCLCTNQIAFFVWSFSFRLIRLALAFSEAFFASSAKSGAPSARDRKTLPGRGDRFAPSRSEKVEWTFVKKLSCCHVVRGCRHKAPKRPRAWISIDVLQIYWSLEQEHLKEKWEQIKLVRHPTMFCQAKLQAPSTTACLRRYIWDGTWASIFWEAAAEKKKGPITHRPCK